MWTGSSENSLVQLKDLERARVLDKAELEAKKGDHQYIIAVDVARSEKKGSAQTSIAVFKIIPRGNGTYFKQLVNINNYQNNMHFEEQSIYIKELVEKYDASMVVVDGNTLGSGLIDFMVKEDKYPAYSVVNDEAYDKYKTPSSLPLIYNMQSNAKDTKASNIHNNFMAVIANNDLKLLNHESNLKQKMNRKNANQEKIAEQMLPHVETTLFIDEVMNLRYEARGNKTTISQISKSMDKDRYSAVSYGLYYIYLLEQKNKERKKETFDAKDFIQIKKPKSKIRGWD